MPRKTLLLILFLIAVTIGLVLLSVSQQKPETEPQTPAKEIVNADSTLSFGEAVIENGSYFTPVLIDSGTNKLTGAQLELIFDPNEVTNVKIEEGNYFKNQIVLLNDVNEKTGRITFAVGVQPEESPSMGSGTVAVVAFTPKPGVDKVNIKFMDKTQVAAKDIRITVLKAATDAKFAIEAQQPATTIKSSTPSAE